MPKPLNESDLPAVDFNFLRSLRDLSEPGGDDPVIELVNMYLSDAPARVKTIQDSAQKADFEGLMQAAHTLKGSSSNLGAKRLAAYCADLESLAHDKDEDGCRQQAIVVSQEFGLVKSSFEEERDRGH